MFVKNAICCAQKLICNFKNILTPLWMVSNDNGDCLFQALGKCTSSVNQSKCSCCEYQICGNQIGSIKEYCNIARSCCNNSNSWIGKVYDKDFEEKDNFIVQLTLQLFPILSEVHITKRQSYCKFG